MSITYRYQTVLRDAGGAVLMDKTVEISSGGSPLIDETIPQNTTDQEIVLNLDASALKGLVILSDKAITLQFNDGAAPDHTKVLVADQPIFWHHLSGLRNPLYADADFVTLTDVTSIFCTTGAIGAGGARLQIWPLQDVSP